MGSVSAFAEPGSMLSCSFMSALKNDMSSSTIQGSWIGDGRCENPYSKNGGDRLPRFWQDRASYRFLPPFFFPPLAAFFAIALIPPFVWDSFARSTLRIAAPLPTGTRRCVHTPLVASFSLRGAFAPRTLLDAHSLAASPARSAPVAHVLSLVRRVAQGERCLKKSGVQSCP